MDTMKNLQFMKMNIGYFFPKKSTPPYPYSINTSMPVPHSIGALSHSAHNRSLCVESDRNAELASMTAFSSTKMEIKTKPKFQRSQSLNSGLDPGMDMDFNPGRSQFAPVNNWVSSQEQFQMAQNNVTLIQNPETRIHIRSYLESIPSDNSSNVRVDEIRYQKDSDSDVNGRRTFIKRYSEPPTLREVRGSSRFNKDVETAKCSTIGLVQDTSATKTHNDVPSVSSRTATPKTKDRQYVAKDVTTTVKKTDSESVVITTKRESTTHPPKAMDGEFSQKRDKKEGETVRKNTATSRTHIQTLVRKESSQSLPRDLNFYPSKESNRQIINDLDKDHSCDGIKTKSRVSLKFLNVQSSETVVQNSRKQLLAMSEEKSKKFLEGKLDKSQGEFVGRSGLHYTSPDTASSKSTEQQAKKTFARSYINEIVKETVFADRKKNELLKLWPSIFHEMIYTAVADMADIQGYSKRCLEEIEKGS